MQDKSETAAYSTSAAWLAKLQLYIVATTASDVKIVVTPLVFFPR